MRRAKHIRCFRHEMHTTEDDKFPIFKFGSKARKLERITVAVCKLNDVVTLIVVTKNDDLVAQFFFQCMNAAHDIFRSRFSDETTPCPLLEKEGVLYYI